MFVLLVLVKGCGWGCDLVDSEMFDQGVGLDDRAACRQVENFVWAFGNVRQLCLLITSGLLSGIGRVQENTATNFRSIICFAKVLITF